MNTLRFPTRTILAFSIALTNAACSKTKSSVEQVLECIQSENKIISMPSQLPEASKSIKYNATTNSAGDTIKISKIAGTWEQISIMLTYKEDHMKLILKNNSDQGTILSGSIQELLTSYASTTVCKGMQESGSGAKFGDTKQNAFTQVLNGISLGAIPISGGKDITGSMKVIDISIDSQGNIKD